MSETGKIKLRWQVIINKNHIKVSDAFKSQWPWAVKTYMQSSVDLIKQLISYGDSVRLILVLLAYFFRITEAKYVLRCCMLLSTQVDGASVCPELTCCRSPSKVVTICAHHFMSWDCDKPAHSLCIPMKIIFDFSQRVMGGVWGATQWSNFKLWYPRKRMFYRAPALPRTSSGGASFWRPLALSLPLPLEVWALTHGSGGAMSAPHWHSPSRQRFCCILRT